MIKNATKYLLYKDGDKVTGWQKVSTKYLETHKNDPANPANRGLELVDSLEGIEIVKKNSSVSKMMQDQIADLVKRVEELEKGKVK